LIKKVNNNVEYLLAIYTPSAGGRSGAGLWGGLLSFEVKNFLILLFAIGNIAIWGAISILNSIKI